MAYHGSWVRGRSIYGHNTVRSNAKISTAKRSRSKASSLDEQATPDLGRGSMDSKPFYRSKPVATSALLCLVGKFEAMDAVSLPIQDSTLQPAPLHSARNSPRKRSRTRDSSQKRLSTILSPTSRDLSRDGDVFIEGYMRNDTWGETPSSTKSTLLRSQKRQFQSRRLRTPQQPAKYIKTPSKSENRMVSSRSTPKNMSGKKPETPAYTLPKKSPNKKIGNMIKDRIRFFDGSPDEELPSSSAKSSPSKSVPSLFAPAHHVYRNNKSPSTSYTTAIETPTFKSTMRGSTNFSRTSEVAKEKITTISSPQKAQYTPVFHRKQRNVFGEAVQNPFLASQGSSEKTRSSNTGFKRLKLETKVETNSRGSSLARYETNATPTRGPLSPESPAQGDERSPDVEIPKQKDDVRQPQRIKDTSSFRSKSKVADMRMRFDGGASFAGTVLPGSVSRDAGPRIVSSVKGENSSIIPVPPPAPLPPIFSSPIRVKSIPNPGTPQHLSPLTQKQKQMSPKFSEFTTSPRKDTLSETIMQRVSVLPLELTEKTAIQRRQKTPARVNNSPVTPQPEKNALQTWPRSGIKKPKQVRNGLIAEKMRLFEDISRKKNDQSIVLSPGKKKQDGESGQGRLAIGSDKMRTRTKTLIEGRKEKFEISPRRDEDKDGEVRKGRINPVFPMAIVTNDEWKGKGKDKGKEKEGPVKDKHEDAGIQIVEVSSPPPPIKSRERPGNRGPRTGSRGRLVGQWNEFYPPGNGDRDGDELAHLPLKRGLRDARMHMGRDGSHSIDWDEVERELAEKGGWRDEDLDGLVGWGEKEKRIEG
ncbi:putative mating-type alpha-pheromone receptor protein [Botrytis fragariae]|uniref:Putative mating-type alpha-pheromone receptor protein n=1 Tax=Botrytis fragariae TaxID=1964551 RepID=A0A8H6EKH5_9HELO|nr:putative mating-type alpha-pheromone receptor protein [Botrytis fragariae]KAF5875220.1 putative mating-type alpha-pheromone receptor protein [Botrytis fragariae]